MGPAFFSSYFFCLSHFRLSSLSLIFALSLQPFLCSLSPSLSLDVSASLSNETQAGASSQANLYCSGFFFGRFCSGCVGYGFGIFDCRCVGCGSRVWVIDWLVGMGFRTTFFLINLWEDSGGGGCEFVALVAMGLCRWWLWVCGVGGGCGFVVGMSLVMSLCWWWLSVLLWQ